MMSITVKEISKHFGENTALNQVDLTIKEGEFFSLLGPSGCGKTTLLNIIAGFLPATTGVVSINGEDVTSLPPYQRNIGMVFQNYALFPHLSVFDNVAYGLKVKKMSKRAIKEKVEEVLKLVHLEEFTKRMPHQLSGGQQQRVAIARALAIEPSVLLLDEPLSNLDAKLRKEMQTELRLLQQRIGITTVLVTHDQEEALSLSDRIGVLGDGHVKQVDQPLTIYRQPKNRFVAEFIGQVNIFEVEAIESEGSYGKYAAKQHKITKDQPLLLETSHKIDHYNQEKQLMMLRPERIQLAEKARDKESNQVEVTVVHTNYIGDSLRVHASLPEQGDFLIHISDTVFQEPPQPGETLYLYWDSTDIIPLVDKE
ncbi:polyamine ABC transporter ATP-binding protein [Gracilibacillus salitolerans]|uniref:Spermidine/putrescine import ATP-binding protein PotA n=1 Tax=Gracilibacillus salitolerans TaxID=2663022 RepID=A0A5Q2TPW1_9BACI|nr:ABC transporter ATP-binding protein [Gracilibacillus salitolerans]QGH36157.1 polyamine ABC transporter ATP-binding protein [Gracilibacillus salitolerans]